MVPKGAIPYMLIQLLIGVMIILNRFLVNLVKVYCSPSIDDIGKDKRNEDRDVAHHLQGEG